MASRARARSTWAAGALSERLRRVKVFRSLGVSGRRGSFWRRDMGHLGARGSSHHYTKAHGGSPTSSSAQRENATAPPSLSGPNQPPGFGLSLRQGRANLSRIAGWRLGGRGACAAVLRHLVSGLIEALGQRGELLLRHPKLASRVGPTLHDPAVFEARRAELGFDLAELAGGRLQLLIVRQSRIALRHESLGLPARRRGRVGEAAPACERRNGERGANQERLFGPEEQIEHGTPLTQHEGR